jgi:hypothetical protein
VERVLEEPNHTRVRKPGPLYTIYTIQFSLVGSKELCLVFRRQYKKAMRLRKYLQKVSCGNRLQSYAPRALFYSILFYSKFMRIKDNIGGLGGGDVGGRGLEALTRSIQGHRVQIGLE